MRKEASTTFTVIYSSFIPKLLQHDTTSYACFHFVAFESYRMVAFQKSMKWFQKRTLLEYIKWILRMFQGNQPFCSEFSIDIKDVVENNLPFRARHTGE